MLTWDDRPSPLDALGAGGVCWSPELGLFVAVGGSGIEYSADGITWTLAGSMPAMSEMHCVCWSPELGIFVAGGAGPFGFGDPIILTSPDGDTWTGFTISADAGNVLGIAWSAAQGQFVAGYTTQSGATLATSPDGEIWTPRSSPFDDGQPWGVAYSPTLDLWCVCGGSTDPEVILTSPTGVVWTAHSTAIDFYSPFAVMWSESIGKFIVVANGDGFIVTSPDGSAWTDFVMSIGGAQFGGGPGANITECPVGIVIVGNNSDSDVVIIEAVDPEADAWISDPPFDASESSSGKAVCYSPELQLLVAVGAWRRTPEDDGTVIATVSLLPTPPPAPGGRGFVGAPWRLIVTDIAARTLSVLDRKATGRQFLFTLNGPAYHTGQVASDDPEINIPFPDLDSPAVMTNNRRLIYALRRETGADPPYVCRFGGIITNFEDQGADAPTSRYTAYDGWQYMMSRPVRDPDTGELPGPAGLTFPGGSLASDIALNLLGATAAIDGETHIDTSDTDLQEATDPLSDPITFDAGLSVGEAWQQLVATGTIDIYLPPLYDPFGFPGKINKFQTAKRLGSTRFSAVMAWDRAGRSLAGVNRLIDGTRLANQVKYFAGQDGAPLQSDAPSIAAYGEWWAQQFFPGEANIGLVELMALAELLIRRNGARNVNLDPAPERTELVLRDYGLGDYLPVWASRNLREPLGIDYDSFDPDFPGASGYHRVFAIPVELDDNGVEMTRGIATASEMASA